METQIIPYALITFFHDLFTAVWIGGLIAMGLTFLPGTKQTLGKGPQTKKILDVIQKRQSVLVYISIAGLLLTGLLMARRTPAFEGLFRLSNAYSTALAIKHLLVALMIAISLYRSLALNRKGSASAPNQEKLSMVLLSTNIILGLSVLLVSGIVVALTNVPTTL